MNQMTTDTQNSEPQSEVQGVAAGSSFYAAPLAGEQFIRITAGRVRDDFDQIGALLAAAARAA